MGYQITLQDGLPQQTWEQDETIATDLLLSCEIARGSFFGFTDFGLPALPKKSSPQTLALIEQRFFAAVKWLIDIGRAKSIDVIAEPDDLERDRINVAMTAEQANGQIVTFETFVEVV